MGSAIQPRTVAKLVRQRQNTKKRTRTKPTTDALHAPMLVYFIHIRFAVWADNLCRLPAQCWAAPIHLLCLSSRLLPALAGECPVTGENY